MGNFLRVKANSALKLVCSVGKSLYKRGANNNPAIPGVGAAKE